MIEITIIKTALDIVKNLIPIGESATRGRISSDQAKTLNKEILELQRHLFTAQECMFALRNENDALSQTISTFKAKVASQENWLAEEARYELHDAGGSVMVRRLRKECVSTTEPVHSICPTCFAKGQKSIVQVTNLANTLYQLKCPLCGELATQMKPFTL